MVIYDEYERERQRKIRHEHRKILELLKDLKFEYVVKENVRAKICFNSGRERFPRNPDKSLNYEASSVVKESQLSGKSKERNLSSVFASTVPRFPEYGRSSFSTFKYQGQKGGYLKNGSFSKAPADREKFLFKENTQIPGPGTYPRDFLSSKKASVLVICEPKFSAVCFLCLKKIPEGCFWRNFRNKRDLCRSCMSQEAHLRKPHRVMMRYTKTSELERFVRVRSCSFFHKHEGTQAAVQFIPSKEVTKRIRCEKYLQRFSNFSKIQ